MKKSNDFIKFGDLELMAKNTFNAVLNGSIVELQIFKNGLMSLIKMEPGVAEVFRQDFSYNWNKLQSFHYFKTGEFVEFPSFVSKQPSLWVVEWTKKAYKQVKKFNLSLNNESGHAIRNFDFESYLLSVNNLKNILNNVCYIDEKVGINFLNNSSEFKCYGKMKKEDDLNRCFINFIYLSAGVSVFKDVLKEEEKKNYLKEIMECYFDKGLNSNESMFRSYLSQKIMSDSEQLEFYLNTKEKFFYPTKNDLGFIGYWNKEVGAELMKEVLIEVFDINRTNVAERIVKKFDYLLLEGKLEKELELKSEQKLVKKSVKI